MPASLNFSSRTIPCRSSVQAFKRSSSASAWARCVDVLHFKRPNSPFTTMDGSGDGTFNQQPATIVFRLTDTAEPGAGQDTAYFLIRSPSGTVRLNCTNWLEGGNHQAHRATGSKQ